jgi:hypothetical protein
MTVIFNVFGWPATSMVPVIGTDYLGLGPKGVGLLASCDGAGGLLGALLIAAIARPAWYGHIFVSGVVLYLVFVVLFASAPNVPVAAVSLFLAGMFNVGFAVMQSTLVHRARRSRYATARRGLYRHHSIGFHRLPAENAYACRHRGTGGAGCLYLPTRRYWRRCCMER